MEFGPRALGARSILASPVRREVNDTINKRLNRSEFMPFAPVVLAGDAATVFDIHPGNAAAARFMTITCDVGRNGASASPRSCMWTGRRARRSSRAADNPLYVDVLTGSTGAPACRCWSTPASTCTRSRSSTGQRNACRLSRTGGLTSWRPAMPSTCRSRFRNSATTSQSRQTDRRNGLSDRSAGKIGWEIARKAG